MLFCFLNMRRAQTPGLPLGLDLLLLTNSDNRGTKRAGECTERLVHTLNNEASHGLGVGEIELHDAGIDSAVLLMNPSFDLFPFWGRLA